MRFKLIIVCYFFYFFLNDFGWSHETYAIVKQLTAKAHGSHILRKPTNQIRCVPKQPIATGSMGTKPKLVSVMWRSPMPTLISGQVSNAHETKWWVKGFFFVVPLTYTHLFFLLFLFSDMEIVCLRNNYYFPIWFLCFKLSLFSRPKIIIFLYFTIDKLDHRPTTWHSI
jgi:hypothetical protein